MAFENLTLFEISLDGARLGPRSLGRRDEDDDAEPAAPSRRGRLAPLAVVALVVVGTALFRSRARRARAEPEDAGEELAGAR